MLAKAEVNLSSGTGAKIPVGRHGEGIQSLAVLTLFNAYLQAWNTGDPIVALEEPEAHLHPSAVRALWQLIEKIPGQKLISTHSGDLLSEVPSDSVVRLHVEGQSARASKLGDVALDPSDSRKFNYHIRRDKGELLFSRCWILGEGETRRDAYSRIGTNLKEGPRKGWHSFCDLPVGHFTGDLPKSCKRHGDPLGGAGR